MREHGKIISEKVAEIAKIADDFPGVVIVHNIQLQFNKTEYMSPRGRKILGLTKEDVDKLGADYFSKYFNEEDAKDYLPKLYDMVQRNNMDQVYSYFQQVRPSPSHPWQWYISSVKILLRDDKGLPLLCITFAVPVDPLHHVTNKVSRLLDENNFLRLHFKEFATLTKREKEIMKQLAKDQSASQIAKSLHITVDTVKTHRKNIYQKLNISSSFGLLEYARAFDLV